MVDRPSARLSRLIVGDTESVHRCRKWCSAVDEHVRWVSEALLGFWDAEGLSVQIQKHAFENLRSRVAQLESALVHSSEHLTCIGDEMRATIAPYADELHEIALSFPVDSDGSDSPSTLVNDFSDRFNRAGRAFRRELGHLVELLDVYRGEKRHAARRKSADGGAEGQDDGGEPNDPTEDALSGQALKLYRFLRDRPHSASYKTLGEQTDFWQHENPSDKTIHRALRRLQGALNALRNAPMLQIEHGVKRARLDK